MGETYIIMGKDLKYAKELKTVDNDEIVRRLRVYLQDEWYGENCRHSLAPFVQNFNNFVPQKKDPVKTFIIECPICNTKHNPNTPCKSKNPAAPLVDILAQKMAMPKDTTEKEKHNALFPDYKKATK